MLLSDAKAIKRFNLGHGWQDDLIVSHSVSKPSGFDWCSLGYSQKNLNVNPSGWKDLPEGVWNTSVKSDPVQRNFSEEEGGKSLQLPDTLLSVHILVCWAGFLSEKAVWAVLGAQRAAGVHSLHRHQGLV